MSTDAIEPVESAQIEIAMLQDQGRVRERQEDSCLAQLLSGGQLALLVVADGMGGHRGGDVASAAAIQAIAAALLPVLASLHPVETLRLPNGQEGDSPIQPASPSPMATIRLSKPTVALQDAAPIREALGQAVQAAQKAVRRAADELGALDDAGSTLTAAVVIGRTLHLAHLGDSRAYLWRQSQLRQLTMDHSGAAALVAAGVIAPAEARSHPTAHQLYRYLGGPANAAKPEITETRLEAGDLLLLCSDGLWGMVEDAGLVGRLLSENDLPALAQALIDAANAAGGDDNITVALARVVGQPV